VKKKILAAVVTLGLALGTAAQSFVLDNSILATSLTLDVPGIPYSGTFGMELWVLGGTSIPPGINLGAAPGSGLRGYDIMLADGFLKEATYANQQTPFPGVFSLGSPLVNGGNGGTVVVALAAWNSSAPSWSAMLAQANQATRAGVVVFDQPIVPFITNPLSPAGLAMNRDLVLTSIPEPPALALGALCAALLFIAHRGRMPIGRFRI